MPLYEYRCKKCDRVFEKIQKFSDAPLETHEDCGGAVERLISAPSLQFKGTGWYITDYARAGASKAKDANGGAPSDSKPAETKTDSAKSDSKNDSKPSPATKSEA